MLIGILQCGHWVNHEVPPHRDYFDLYSDMLAGRGLTFRKWSPVDMDFPASVHDAEGWLISGSRHGAYEDHPWIPPLEEFIRDAYREKVPMVGVCFGHQIMAQALGGTVVKHPGGWSLGNVDYDFDTGSMALNAFHQDQVVTPPPNARTIASSDFCEHAAFAYDGGPFLSVQPHPEFGRDELETLIDARRNIINAPDRFQWAEDRLDLPLANDAIADRIAAFFKENRQ